MLLCYVIIFEICIYVNMYSYFTNGAKTIFHLSVETQREYIK